MTQPTTFSELPLEPTVLQALANMGFETMTPVQALSIPHLLSGVDFLGQAPTGTGKTAAFAIPLVNQLTPGAGYVQALVIAPTRELVQQIALEVNAIGAVKGVKAMAVFGGEKIRGQKETLREGTVDVVIGTPGRVLDHLGQVSLDFSKTRLVVLDECDVMLDMGFIEDIEKILDHTPQGRQTWLFSATISKESLKMANRHLMYPEEVRIQPQKHATEIIEQYYFILEPQERVRRLRKMLEDIPDLYGIVFCQSKKGVVDLTRQLRDKYPVECVHGAMMQGERDRVMERFRNKEYKMIVATDVLARGIDIERLTHIINYDPPRDPEAYIHRIGRTARAGELGIAITFFSPDDLYDYQQLERRVGMPLTKHPETLLEFNPLGSRKSSGGGYGQRRSFGGGSSSGGRSGPPSSGSGNNRNRRRRPAPKAT